MAVRRVPFSMTMDWTDANGSGTVTTGGGDITSTYVNGPAFPFIIQSVKGSLLRAGTSTPLPLEASATAANNTEKFGDLITLAFSFSAGNYNAQNKPMPIVNFLEGRARTVLDTPWRVGPKDSLACVMNNQCGVDIKPKLTFHGYLEVEDAAAGNAAA